jgi:hypothetical protein
MENKIHKEFINPLKDREPTKEEVKEFRKWIKNEYQFRLNNITSWPTVIRKRIISLLAKIYY